ncbi:MAG: hypothetical protein IIZ92_10535 [Aquincola sp.]|uniref:hypothetical protein n=1 Tax=uncultured Aquincola sp. TaxID=886556 RepID=UPI0032B2459A|nr:hypothetical protein [Aquincola sp.]|tara:strand:+ start:769 stop:1017 length:249 start_codon:yes stop_codon:yes gene_type:complete
MPASSITLPPPLLGETLAAHGFDAGDFEVEHDPEPDLSAALGLQDSLLLVRRRSTGAVRFYLGASWYTAVVSDLTTGEFGRA